MHDTCKGFQRFLLVDHQGGDLFPTTCIIFKFHYCSQRHDICLKPILDKVDFLKVTVWRNSQNTDFFVDQFCKNFDSIIALLYFVFVRINDKRPFLVVEFKVKVMVLSFNLKLVVQGFVSKTVMVREIFACEKLRWIDEVQIKFFKSGFSSSDCQVYDREFFCLFLQTQWNLIFDQVKPDDQQVLKLDFLAFDSLVNQTEFFHFLEGLCIDQTLFVQPWKLHDSVFNGDFFALHFIQVPGYDRASHIELIIFRNVRRKLFCCLELFFFECALDWILNNEWLGILSLEILADKQQTFLDLPLFTIVLVFVEDCWVTEIDNFANVLEGQDISFVGFLVGGVWKQVLHDFDFFLTYCCSDFASSFISAWFSTIFGERILFLYLCRRWFCFMGLFFVFPDPFGFSFVLNWVGWLWLCLTLRAVLILWVRNVLI